ncbi:hypothetical protein PTTG_06514 [Puccinia triticina 1-1 BBBD Race 1]|uniref:HEME_HALOPEROXIDASE domain-containing protein n=2 Tax=Puccinia triticina TaxID=208348 RepID=A0A0C4F098_PUCT1|nr:uncharacterized protein PtA15_5A924 [Puccinia triticina]OAV91672.1 hypothetical protein PTTG_06514 [Puccinia triticina 1-1 BBBD Race 1]WAQ85349.1 hypothetical protein PtA15_5A924 [Puccinia triticina]WAR58638.1 hypothetical protein PtB15_5B873 [Puccinia triticina]
MVFHTDQPTDIQLNDLEKSGHSYNRKRLGCPCPGISILVNHGYLTPASKHDRIKLGELIKALVKCFNLSWIHAAFLSILAIILCGKGLSVSISELGTHDRIEHDGSITRHDHGAGDSLNPDEKLIDEFLDTRAIPHPVSLSDFALRRAELATFARRPLSLKARMTALGEVGLIFSIFGNRQDSVHSTSLENIYLHEKLPREWNKPKRPISIWDVVKIGWHLNKKIKVYNKTKG